MLIGTEHEYSLNSRSLQPLPESDRILGELSGPGSSEAPFGMVTLTKELQKTVIEFVPDHPAETIRELEGMVTDGTTSFFRRFGDRYCLLGLGMHPSLRLSQTAVWDSDEQEYYAAYDRIFGLFNRLVRMEEYEGTGAGLAIARKAAEKQGGRIWAESVPSQGATFYVELPNPHAAWQQGE